MPVSNELVSFVENTSFRVYMVNVWDFYSNGRCSPASQDRRREAKTTTKPNDMVNFKRAYNRLAELIEVNNGCGNNQDSLLESSNDDLDMIVASPVSVRTNRGRKKRSVSVSGTGVDLTEKSASILCKNIYSQINVIGEIKDVQVKIDHSQVLFLLRLVDTIDLFTKQLKKDSEKTLQYKVNSLIMLIYVKLC